MFQGTAEISLRGTILEVLYYARYVTMRQRHTFCSQVTAMHVCWNCCGTFVILAKRLFNYFQFVFNHN